MEVVLIQGHSNTGKTTLCKKIAKYLVIADFKEVIRENVNNPDKDFRAIYVHKQCKTRVIINSGSDLITLVREFDKLYKQNKKNDILITAIRIPNTIIYKHDVHKGIKDIYKNDFVEEHIIDLDVEKKKNEDLDFCEFIDKILKDHGCKILEKIKNKLNCKIEIDCTPMIKKC
ncbi:MAG: ATP-binding protein [Myroides sp.]